MKGNKTEGIILVELVSYIEDFLLTETLPVMKLSYLDKLYESRLQELNSTFSRK